MNQFCLARITVNRVPIGRMTLSKVSFGALVIALFLAGASAEAQDDQQRTFRTRSNLVLAPTLVKSQDGEIIYGLQAKDFIIEDDGVEQAVHLDETDAPGPISLVIVIQRGGAAEAEKSRMKGLGAILEPILSQGQTQAAIVTFDSEVKLVRDFTFDPNVISEDLKALRLGYEGAAILDATHFAVELLKKTPEDSRRIVLLISETRDHGSHLFTVDDVVKAVGESNAVVYSLAFSPTLSEVLDSGRGENLKDPVVQPGVLNVDIVAMMRLAAQAMRRNVPKAIASMTGGEYELFKSRHGFDDLVNSFANHLSSRYQLSFEPKQPHPGLHGLRVRLREPGKATVLARTSYWVEPTESAPQ